MVRLGIVITLLPLALGCERVARLVQGEEPERYEYLVKFVNDKGYNDSSFEGAFLLVDGKEFGPIKKGADSIYENHLGVRVTLKSKHTFAGRSAKLELRLPTPCGTTDVDLDDYELVKDKHPSVDDPVERERRGRRNRHSRASKRPYTVEIRPHENVDLPDEVVVWVDDLDDQEASVSFGKADIGPEWVVGRADDRTKLGRRKVLWDPSCATEHVVEVGGKEVGAARVEEGARGYLITTSPGICHRMTRVIYSSSIVLPGGSSKSFHLPSARVQSIRSKLDYFLRPAPRSLKGSGTAARRALERVECKATKQNGTKP